MKHKFIQLRLQGVRDPFMSMANGGGKSDAPAQPDYVAAANATAQGNLANTRLQLAANRVNQNTPTGSLNYTQSGTDQYGNPTYTANQTLSAPQQNILTSSENATQGALTAANAGLPNVTQSLTQGGVDLSGLPSYGIDPGQTYSDAVMSRLAPQIAQQNEMSDAALANQGIAPGTEAYTNAKRQLVQNQNDLQTSAIINGMNTGLNANNQAFNQQLTNLNNPITQFNNLRSGSTTTTPSYVNPASMGSTAGADILGATQAGYSSGLGATNAANAANSSFNTGLMGLGGSLINGGYLGSLPLGAAGTGSGLLGGISSGLSSLGSYLGLVA